MRHAALSLPVLAGLALLAGCDRAEEPPPRPTVAAMVAALPPADTAARPASFRVLRAGSVPGRGDTGVGFPDGDVETAPRITEADGGSLDLARSRDGRQLWVRRAWDDGTADVNRFTLDFRSDPRFVLQFVDGVVVPADGVRGGAAEHVRRFREGDRWFALLLQAWVVDRARGEARRPGDGVWYPLVRAPGTAESVAPDELQWMAFVPRCAETGGGCVYYGDPARVCARYLDGTTVAGGQQLWIAPREGCGAQE